MSAPLYLMPNDMFNPFILSERIADTRFRWASACWLEKWQIHVCPPPEVRKNIELVAVKLERICHDFKANAFVTSFYRPETYNKLIGGAQQSMHIDGGAIDFWLEGWNCNKLREALEPKLEQYQIRLENKKDASWLHIDIRDPSKTFGSRYFIP